MRSRKTSSLGVVLHAFFIVITLSLLGCRGYLNDEGQAVKALETAGYSDISVNSHKWFWVSLRGCGADASRFDAEAVNPAGRKVSVYVCVGWPLKGATIRSE